MQHSGSNTRTPSCQCLGEENPTKSRQNREYSRKQQRAVTRPRQPLREKQHSFGVRSLSCAREAIVHRPMVSTADGRLHPAANAADIATSNDGQQLSAAALNTSMEPRCSDFFIAQARSNWHVSSLALRISTRTLAPQRSHKHVTG